jgi:hypothetical protein
VLVQVGGVQAEVREQCPLVGGRGESGRWRTPFRDKAEQNSGLVPNCSEHSSGLMVNTDSGAMANTFCACPESRSASPDRFPQRTGDAGQKHGDLILFQTWRSDFANKEAVHA